MRPTNRCVCWLLVCTALLLTGGTSALQGGPTARDLELRKLLSTPIQFEGYDDPKTTFADALDSLSKRYNLSFDINEQAFKDADIKDVDKMLIVEHGKIPEMHARLERVLKKVLSRVSPLATYIIRDDVIEITTTQAIRKEFFPNRPCGPLPPLVSGSFEKVPLETALKELTPRSSTVVLDSRLAKEAATPVTANLVNVPLDTAVGMLADMAGLKMVPLENALYVTSIENAATLMEEQEQLRLKRRQEQKEKAEKKKTDKPAANPAPLKTEAVPGKGGT